MGKEGSLQDPACPEENSDGFLSITRSRRNILKTVTTFSSFRNLEHLLSAGHPARC